MTKTEKTTGRMPNAALMKPVQPDDVLAVIVGFALEVQRSS